MVAKLQIHKGNRWKIGDDNSVSIWNDHWISCMSPIGTHACQEYRGLEMQKVAKLINNQTHWWDVEKITSYFEPHVAREILKVNLLQEEHETT